MQTALVFECVSCLQNDLYRKLNNYAESHKILGRFGSIPIALLDVGLDTLKAPLAAIEAVAMGAINLIGVVFVDKKHTVNECTLKDALANTEWALRHIVTTPVMLVIAPIKILFQFFAILIDPETVQSINYRKPTFWSLDSEYVEVDSDCVRFAGERQREVDGENFEEDGACVEDNVRFAGERQREVDGEVRRILLEDEERRSAGNNDVSEFAPSQYA